MTDKELTTDKDLLLLAAKAAGHKMLKQYDNDLGVLIQCASHGSCWWNPLTDDGDALRLAVKLKILDSADYHHFLALELMVNASDPYAATRRAIVRAAAEIGKGMK